MPVMPGRTLDETGAGPAGAGPPAAAGGPAATAACPLPGEAADLFHFRFNLRQAEVGHLADVIILGLCLAGLQRCWHIFVEDSPWRPAMLGWQLAAVAGCTAKLAWRIRGRSSYVQHRELPTALMRVVCTGFGLGSVLMRRLLDESPLPSCAQEGGGGCDGPLAFAAHFLLLMFASGTIHAVLFAAAWRVRLGLSILAQLALMASMLPQNEAICESALLSHPAMQRTTSHVYQLLSLLGHSLPLALSPYARPTTVAECFIIFKWLQLVVGFMLPLCWEAASTAHLFHLHQKQRADQGLPPERGLHAAAYHAIWQLSSNASGLPLGALLWVGLAIAFDWASFFSVPLHMRQPVEP